MASNQMPRVDMSKEFGNLNDVDKHFVKKLEQMNKERARDLKGLRGRNKLVGLLFGGAAVGIYLYTIYAVRQERFLDDFDEAPKKSS